MTQYDSHLTHTSLAVMSGLTTIDGLNLPRSDKGEVKSNTRRNFSKISLGHIWPVLNLQSLKKSLIGVRLMSGRVSLSSFKSFCDLLYVSRSVRWTFHYSINNNIKSSIGIEALALEEFQKFCWRPVQLLLAGLVGRLKHWLEIMNTRVILIKAISLVRCSI